VADRDRTGRASAATATLSQGTLFRAEAILAVAVGLLVLVRPRTSSWVATRKERG
jgi:hypothetical protein